MANFAAGFGDAVTFGLTYVVRDAIDANDVVDQGSGSYVAGTLAGAAADAALTEGLASEASAGEAAQGGRIAAKVGEAGGPGAGKNFSRATMDAAREESGNRCVFCGEETVRSKTPSPNRSNIDHAIPKSRGGNNTIRNAQNTCQTCNLKKSTMTTEEYLRSQKP